MPLTLSGTNGVSGVDGSASTPANRGSDTNTGIVYGTDTVQIATGGTTAVTVDSSQNVGIGTATPGAKLEISGGNALFGNNNEFRFKGSTGYTAGTTGALFLKYSDNNFYLDNYDGATIFRRASYAENARFDTSGNFNLGTSTTVSGARLNVASSSNLLQFGGSVGPSSAFTAYLYCGTNGLAIQTATTGGIGAIQFYNPNGVVGSIVTNGSATAYNTSSDYRLKENVLPMSGALDKVAQLKPVTYTWKADGSDGQGFIAHELQAVVPDCVTGEKDAVDADGNPVYQGVDTSFLVATLTAAIQELSAKLDAAEARIAALEAK